MISISDYLKVVVTKLLKHVFCGSNVKIFKRVGPTRLSLDAGLFLSRANGTLMMIDCC